MFSSQRKRFAFIATTYRSTQGRDADPGSHDEKALFPSGSASAAHHYVPHRARNDQGVSNSS